MRFDDEDLVTFQEAATLPPKPRHPATVWRWANIGICGVRLASLDIGGTAFTSRSALQAFFDEVTAAKKARKP